MGPLRNEPSYAEVLAREFNMVVAENAFKPSEVWRQPNEYNFTATDYLADFAEKHGMILRGHTLVWHSQMPHWLATSSFSPSELCDMLRTYIHTLVGRYRGRVAQWDVVNEAVHDPDDHGSEPSLRKDSPWYAALGPDYLRLAFQWAHEADPEARLYYNDYEMEDLGPKSDAVYRLVNQLRDAGAPIHGVGFQGHLLEGWRSTESHHRNIRRFANAGFDWQITEADIRLYLNGQLPTAEQLATQAEGFHDLARLCLTEPNCHGLVFWGFTDRHSWIPDFRPGWGASLPLDESYQPKPAYEAVSDALRTGR